MKVFLKRSSLYFLFLFLGGILYSQELEKFFPDKNSENNWAKLENFSPALFPEKIEFKKDTTDENKSCQYPNENIYPGKDILPKISDEKRVNAILELIKKIANCVTLPFKEDGQIFKNKEGLLPPMESGYYREYTLVVPKDAENQFYIGETLYTALPSYGKRGPERIIIGGGTIIYYSPTHYRNFVKIEVLQKNKENYYQTIYSLPASNQRQ